MVNVILKYLPSAPFLSNNVPTNLKCTAYSKQLHLITIQAPLYAFPVVLAFDT